MDIQCRLLQVYNTERFGMNIQLFLDHHRNGKLKHDIAFIPARFILFTTQPEGMDSKYL